MFRLKRSDTRVATIERAYGINLNARADLLLGNLLDQRGFDTQSQLLDAYYGRLSYHPRKRRIFLSFHAEDKRQVQGFRLMSKNPQMREHAFHESSLSVPINSEDGTYLRTTLREKINRCVVLVCLIGNGTAWREWVDWEVCTAYDLRKGVCGVRLKGSNGRTPPELIERGAPVASWNMDQIVCAIECAAARRS